MLTAGTSPHLGLLLPRIYTDRQGGPGAGTGLRSPSPLPGEPPESSRPSPLGLQFPSERKSAGPARALATPGEGVQGAARQDADGTPEGPLCGHCTPLQGKPTALGSRDLASAHHSPPLPGVPGPLTAQDPPPTTETRGPLSAAQSRRPSGRSAPASRGARGCHGNSAPPPSWALWRTGRAGLGDRIPPGRLGVPVTHVRDYDSGRWDGHRAFSVNDTSRAPSTPSPPGTGRQRTAGVELRVGHGLGQPGTCQGHPWSAGSGAEMRVG